MWLTCLPVSKSPEASLRATTACPLPLLQHLCAALVGVKRLRGKLHATPQAAIVVMHSSSLGQPGGAAGTCVPSSVGLPCTATGASGAARAVL